MRTVVKAVLTVAALMLALVVGAVPAAAAGATGGTVPAAVVQLSGGGHRLAAGSTAQPTDQNTDPDGNVNQQRKQADAAQARDKLIIGVVAAALLVIVYFGHRQRAKSRVRKKNLQHAKS